MKQPVSEPNFNSKRSTARIMTEQQVCEMLHLKKNTVILLHARPDGDALGSAFALRALLEAMGMRAYCLCANEIPHRLAFLCRGVQDSLLPASLPVDFEVERVVSVDVASPTQLGVLEQDWLSRVDVMIDHHEMGTPFAPAWVVPKAAATGELIFALARRWVADGTIGEIPYKAAVGMYAAIASDTGGFRYSNVTEQTHWCAAELLRCGIDAAAINHALFESKPYDMMRAEQIGFSVLRRYEEGTITVIPFSYDMKVEHGIADEYMETLVDIARAVEGTEVALAIRQPTREGTFRVSARSNGAFHVAALCASFGGGGHEKAAGCTMQADDIETVVERLVTAICAQKEGQDVGQ